MRRLFQRLYDLALYVRVWYDLRILRLGDEEE